MRRYIRIALQVILFVPLVIGLALSHSGAALWFSGLPDFFHTRPLQLAAILVGAVLAGISVAVVFAYPLVVVYRRGAVLAAATAALLTAAWHAFLVATNMPVGTFVLLAVVLGDLCLIVFPPAAVWALQRVRA